MNLRKLPALLLAAALQVLPVSRVACVNSVAAPTGFAVVMQWLAGAVALLGSYHAVSGASAAVTGVAPINPVTQVPTGPVTTSAVGTNGQTFAYRINVTNPGVNPQQAFFFVSPLPPGLAINTNLGGNGVITGVPTAPGVYFPVTLTAGNANYSNVVTTNITITIVGTGTASAPTITTPPANQTVAVGTNVSFTVTANGTAPLGYAWSFNGSAITGATTSTLQLSKVQTNNSGTYSVTVTNSAGSKSTSATLTVLIPPAVLTAPTSQTVTNGATALFSVVVSGSAPAYQWKFNGNNLAGATSSSLSVADVQGTNQGDYTVVVSNAVGVVTSPAAHLTVQTQVSGPFQLASPLASNGSFSFDITAPAQTNVVIWTSTDLSHWTAVSTNSTSTGTAHFSGSASSSAVGFYRATMGH